MPQELKPHKVTKPIQLLAAWLLGLVLVDSIFLGAAKALSTPTWLPAVLVIAAVCNVPLFLICIFLLQTRFRPQMQEDVYYSRYLRIQQETRKPRSSDEEMAELREATTAYQRQIVDGLANLESSMLQLRGSVTSLKGTEGRQAVEGALVKSEEALHEVRLGIQWAGNRVEVNDLLPNYKEIRKILFESQINVTRTFGSTSDDAQPPIYRVLAFGVGVSGAAIFQLCQLLKHCGEWYVNLSDDDINAGIIYIGAYGYGGEPVARLSDDLLDYMARPDFSWDSLNQWLRLNASTLDADYSIRPREL